MDATWLLSRCGDPMGCFRLEWNTSKPIRMGKRKKERTERMSTRAMIHFHDGDNKKPAAIIYRHNDGYPEGLGKDLESFLAEVDANLKDKRFGDAEYLAAKWIVWDAKQQVDYEGKTRHYLDFLSVGVSLKDHGDIEYRYHVWCRGDGKPEVTYDKV